MPVTITSVTGALTVDITEDNFDNIEEFLREHVLNQDLNPNITRLFVRRWSGGRIQEVWSLGSNPWIIDGVSDARSVSELRLLQGTFEMNTRNRYPAVAPDRTADRPEQLMEFLGTPGKTLWWEFQEDELSSPTSGWSPSGAPEGEATTGNYGEFPENECFSWWLTAPHGGVKVSVMSPCIAKVSANFVANLCFSQIIAKIREGTGGWPGARTAPIVAGHPEGGSFVGDGPAMRVGLFVDTNPELRDADWAGARNKEPEFSNSNPRIATKSSVGWVTSPYKTWSQIEAKTIHAALRTSDSIVGEVALKGNGFYNFSLKFRDANTHGYIDQSTFQVGDWEASALPVSYRLTDPDLFGSVPYTNFWEQVALHVEFTYSRETAYLDDEDEPEFDVGP